LESAAHFSGSIGVYGYDVKSFEPDGQEQFLEIKTTCGHERTAFWLTRHEVDVAAEKKRTTRTQLKLICPSASIRFRISS
jgi:hypothetical protein